jgi:ribosomal protein S18 acetylase RimI-like enzyme
MIRHEVSSLTPNDFADVIELEERLFGSKGEKLLGPFYVRLCCDFYGDTSFIARVDGKPVAYILAFIRDRECYCSTLAIVPEFQRTRIVHHLLRAFIREIAYRVDTLWFTVSEDNSEARALHATLGAHELGVTEEYFGPGEPRIVSRIEPEAFEKLRQRMLHLDALDERRRAAAAKVA